MNTFWHWFFRGVGEGAGVLRFWDRWLFLHVFVGAFLAIALPVTLTKAATALLLPVAGIFIGLSFAWGGNAQALLQTSEIEDVSAFRAGGYEEYVFAFQAAILLILITLGMWALAGLAIFDCVWPTKDHSEMYAAISFMLFFLSSMTLRECWHVVLGAQSLLIMRFKIKQSKEKK